MMTSPTPERVTVSSAGLGGVDGVAEASGPIRQEAVGPLSASTPPTVPATASSTEGGTGGGDHQRPTVPWRGRLGRRRLPSSGGSYELA